MVLIRFDFLEGPRGSAVSLANFVTPVSTYRQQVCHMNQVCKVQMQLTLALCVTWSMDEPRGFSHYTNEGTRSNNPKS